MGTYHPYPGTGVVAVSAEIGQLGYSFSVSRLRSPESYVTCFFRSLTHLEEATWGSCSCLPKIVVSKIDHVLSGIYFTTKRGARADSCRRFTGAKPRWVTRLSGDPGTGLELFFFLRRWHWRAKKLSLPNHCHDHYSTNSRRLFQFASDFFRCSIPTNSSAYPESCNSILFFPLSLSRSLFSLSSSSSGSRRGRKWKNVTISIRWGCETCIPTLSNKVSNFYFWFYSFMRNFAVFSTYLHGNPWTNNASAIYIGRKVFFLFLATCEAVH